jgi:hypothetical protein
VQSEGVRQRLSLGLNRNDFMLDCGVTTADLLASGEHVDPSKVTIKQIEFNTMAASFSGLGMKVSQAHRYLLISEFRIDFTMFFFSSRFILTEMGEIDKIHNVSLNKQTLVLLFQLNCTVYNSFLLIQLFLLIRLCLFQIYILMCNVRHTLIGRVLNE